jgi:hypothetical protein
MRGLVERHSLFFGFVRVASDERLDSYGLRMFLAANLWSLCFRGCVISNELRIGQSIAISKADLVSES